MNHSRRNLIATGAMALVPLSWPGKLAARHQEEEPSTYVAIAANWFTLTTASLDRFGDTLIRSKATWYIDPESMVSFISESGVWKALKEVISTVKPPAIYAGDHEIIVNLIETLSAAADHFAKAVIDEDKQASLDGVQQTTIAQLKVADFMATDLYRAMPDRAGD